MNLHSKRFNEIFLKKQDKSLPTEYGLKWLFGKKQGERE